jgi:putative intracellular protease/amidase
MFRSVTVRTFKKASVVLLVLLAVGALAFGGWLFSLPPTVAAAPPAAISPEEHAATVAALKPPKRQRPVIAVIGINDGTETTDYLMPTGILRRADIAEVLLVATGAGAVQLYPALKVDADLTIEAFDARYPEGADYVLVPAMRRSDDERVSSWLRQQSGSGAIVIGVCVGATVVAHAGLLDGRRGTTHWYYIEDMIEAHPSIQYVPDRRYVVDRGVATTTGITASMPMSLTLIEAIAGRAKAEEIARELGISSWDARHRSDAFRFTREFASTVLANKLSFWNREEFSIELTAGMDEVTLALLADAWSRTYRSRAVAYAALPDAVLTRQGLRIHPERAISSALPPPVLPIGHVGAPAHALEQTLSDIHNRYGTRTGAAVAVQLEYPATH